MSTAKPDYRPLFDLIKEYLRIGLNAPSHKRSANEVAAAGAPELVLSRSNRFVTSCHIHFRRPPAVGVFNDLGSFWPTH